MSHSSSSASPSEPRSVPPVAQTRPVIQQGNPVLRQTARSISSQCLTAESLTAEPLTGSTTALQTLIDELIATAIATNGVGIAAPQIAASERLFIIASRPNERYPNAPKMEPTAMINPVLIDRSDQEELGWEGCLSVPDRRGQVSRAKDIRVEYLDRWGALQRSQFSGFVARIFQHELDHLNGILFVDHVAPADLVSEVEYLQRLSRESHPSN